jgi:hypothetical protein
MFLVKKTLFIFVNNQQNQLICQKLVGDTTVARFSICLNIIVIRFNIWLNIRFSAFSPWVVAVAQCERSLS